MSQEMPNMNAQNILGKPYLKDYLNAYIRRALSVGNLPVSVSVCALLEGHVSAILRAAEHTNPASQHQGS